MDLIDLNASDRYWHLHQASIRLVGLYISRVTVGGPEDPAMQEAIAINRRARGVDLDDAQAQVDLYNEFVERFKAFPR